MREHMSGSLELMKMKDELAIVAGPDLAQKMSKVMRQVQAVAVARDDNEGLYEYSSELYDFIQALHLDLQGER